MPLPLEEYIEQTFFFETFRARLENGFSAQEFLTIIRNELLTTTQLPLAVDFLLTDMKHTGILSGAMARLEHYFTPFQTFVIAESEREEGRFDFRIALEVLAHEVKYRSQNPPVQGLFFYQFETLCRNRLGYDRGLEVMIRDDVYDDDWKTWFGILRRQIGLIDLADMIFYRSEFYKQKNKDMAVSVLFGEREGRIAFATRKRDPMYLFSALSRHLGYPSVPRQEHAAEEENLIPVLQRRIEHLENRLQLIEEELRGGINLNRYFVH
ncbi:MAG: hypothetical protein LBC20_13020 [Planctomycetaceae bacterium]|jgi:hypothetical protein|nr:hypothetical protein [Planctomycetaceae bacterium]